MKIRIEKENLVIIIFLSILLMTSIVSLHQCIQWLIENKNIENQLNEINSLVNIIETEDSDKTEIIEPEEITVPDEPQIESSTEKEEVYYPNYYWNYINTNLIDVNFEELKKINSSTVGWIQVSGTNINYPFVQAKDNDYYLTRSFDKTYNSAGWIFMDYRNNSADYDRNTIIYAHGRLDKTMFGSLKNILTSGWLDNPNNYTIKLSTETENTLWQVFSVYHIPTTNDYIRVYFLHNNDFLEFATMLQNRSAYNFNTTVNSTDKILTLSTCYNKTDKVVLHAKLIKREAK